MRTLILMAALIMAMTACSDDDTGEAKDGGAPPADGKQLKDKGKPPADKGKPPADKGKPPADKGEPDAGLATIKEKEPNDGATATEYQTVSWPIQITGAIGKANDTDLFRITAKAGDRLVVKVTPSAQLQPHLVIFDQKGKLPTAANAGPKAIMAEYYMLKSDDLLVGVRDRRNVIKPVQGVGGSGFTYTLSITRLKRAPTPVTISVEKSGTLSPAGTVRVFSYTATQGLDIQLTVKAKKLASPSDVDSRLSLFHPGQKAWLGTNDNPSLGVSDSVLKGKMPFNGTYHAIVENVELGATDLRFAFRATTIK